MLKTRDTRLLGNDKENEKQEENLKSKQTKNEPIEKEQIGENITAEVLFHLFLFF